MPMIEATLARSGLSYADLDRIAVTTGPGSFTGVRVGIAAARALALALELPTVGVGSLAAVAFDALQKHATGTAVAALDATRSEVYVRIVDIASGAVQVEACAMAIEDVVAMMSHAEPPILLAGSGAAAIASMLTDLETCVTHTLDAPDISAVAFLGLLDDAVSPPVPFYGRGADAKPQLGKAVARA